MCEFICELLMCCPCLPYYYTVSCTTIHSWPVYTHYFVLLEHTVLLCTIRSASRYVTVVDLDICVTPPHANRKPPTASSKSLRGRCRDNSTYKLPQMSVWSSSPPPPSSSSLIRCLYFMCLTEHGGRLPSARKRPSFIRPHGVQNPGGGQPEIDAVGRFPSLAHVKIYV